MKVITFLLEQFKIIFFIIAQSLKWIKIKIKMLAQPNIICVHKYTLLCLD